MRTPAIVVNFKTYQKVDGDGGVELALLNIDNTENCKRYLNDALQASQKAVRLASKFR